jgi:hypothetical protein
LGIWLTANNRQEDRIQVIPGAEGLPRAMDFLLWYQAHKTLNLSDFFVDLGLTPLQRKKEKKKSFTFDDLPRDSRSIERERRQVGKDK